MFTSIAKLIFNTMLLIFALALFADFLIAFSYYQDVKREAYQVGKYVTLGTPSPEDLLNREIFLTPENVHKATEIFVYNKYETEGFDCTSPSIAGSTSTISCERAGSNLGKVVIEVEHLAVPAGTSTEYGARVKVTKQFISTSNIVSFMQSGSGTRTIDISKENKFRAYVGAQ